MLLVNLFGGPGIGKTTTALTLVAELKKSGIEAEYLSETARELAYAGQLLKIDQFSIFMSQLERQYRLVGTGIQVAVTDSPMLLQAAYSQTEADAQRAIHAHYGFSRSSLDFVMRRQEFCGHSTVGRLHDLQESVVLDKKIEELTEAHCLRSYSLYPQNISPAISIIKGEISRHC